MGIGKILQLLWVSISSLLDMESNELMLRNPLVDASEF